MQSQILKSKLFIPPARPDSVNRLRLLEKMNLSINRKLTLVSAPAGFGKTTLVSQWIKNSKCKIAWLSLDETDSDFSRFITYLMSAIQTVYPKLGNDILGLIQSGQPPIIKNLFTPLLNEIAEVDDKLILILDDYHQIDSAQIDSSIQLILDHLPPTMHLIIVTREDPSLPLANLRAQGQLTELRAADLRFTISEAESFLKTLAGIELTTENIKALELRTEGWIAGLQLAAINLQGKKDVEPFIQSFTGSNQFIMDYLVEEVLLKQPVETQRFLLSTSILNRLNSSLCATILDISENSCRGHLKQLEQANLFLIPLDDERNWYRYHHLFAELLRNNLQHRSEAEETFVESPSTLHDKASKWFEDNSFPIESVQHALLSGNSDHAADLIELAWPDMERSFQSHIWLGLVERLSSEIIEKRPVLCANLGSSLIMKGEFEEGEYWLNKAEQWLSKPPSESSQEMTVNDKNQLNNLPASIAETRVYLAQSLDDDENVVKYANIALELLPDDDYVRKGIAKGLMGCTLWANGELDKAYKAFEEVKAGHHIAKNYHFELAIVLGLGGIQVTKGELTKTIELYKQTIQLAFDPKYSAKAVAADIYLELSQLQLERGELDHAIESHQKSKELADQAALSDWHYRWVIAQAKILEFQMKWDEAILAYDQANELFLKTPRPNLRPISAMKVRVQLRKGELSGPVQWVQEKEFDLDRIPVYLNEFSYLTFAKVLITQFAKEQQHQNINRLSIVLNQMLDKAREEGRVFSVLEILIIQALMFQTQNNTEKAVEKLSEALQLAEPQCFIRPFINEGSPMENLLRSMHRQGIEISFIDTLLQYFDTSESTSLEKTSNETDKTSQPLVEPLSKRELEVLKLIAEGLSNKEIGERLFLSLSTIKGHNQNIFAKLQVQRRTEAILRAKELGLV